METFQALFNTIVVIFIVATMLTAGLVTTLPMLAATFRRVPLVILVLGANLVVVPLMGWGIGAALGLSSASFIAIVMLGSSPGGPFGAKLAMVQHGDVTAGASMQVLLAAIGSVTFPITLGWILTASGQGGGVSIDVEQLVATVAVLQLIPFAIGIALRHSVTDLADELRPWALRISNLTFVVVLAMMLLGSFQTIVDLIGSASLLAGFLFAVGAVIVGFVVSTGPLETRTTMSTVAPVRNTGPILAAIALAFGNDPAIIGAVVAQLVMGLVVVIVTVVVIVRVRGGRAGSAAPATPTAATPGPAS